MLRTLRQCQRGGLAAISRSNCAARSFHAGSVPATRSLCHALSKARALIAPAGRHCFLSRGMCSSSPKDDTEKTDEQLLEEHKSAIPKWGSFAFYQKCTVREFLDMMRFITKYYYYSESNDYDGYRPISPPPSVSEDDHYWAMIKDDHSWDSIMSPFNKMVFLQLKKHGFWDFLNTFPIEAMHTCEHGLLRKYNFDLFEFMAGSKEAVRRINFITTSRGFVEAAAAGAGSTTEDALLKEMTHPMFYRQSREAMDEVSRHPVYMELQELDVERVTVNGLLVEIVTESDVESRPKRSDNPPAQSESSLDDHPEALDYPAGAVVVTVQMMFKTNERFLPRFNPLKQHPGIDSDALPFAMDQSMRHKLSNAWTFRGCISGHVPLEWRVCGVGGVYFR